VICDAGRIISLDVLVWSVAGRFSENEDLRSSV
jgi:hypothetical protein